MKNKKAKKGFTLVELLVVITILAVLATVSVIGYKSFTKKAQISNDISLTTQMNTILQANQVRDGKNETPHEAVEELIDGGVNINKLTPMTNGYLYVFDLEENEMVLLDESMNAVAPEDTTLRTSKTNYFIFVGKDDELKEAKYNGYSFYLKNDFHSGSELSINTGIDVGDNKNITSIKYEHSTGDKQTVTLRTNGGTLVVNGLGGVNGDTVNHFGWVKELEVKAVATSDCYHEHGFVGKLTSFTSGKFVAYNEARFHQTQAEIEAVLGSNEKDLSKAKFGDHYFNEKGICVIETCTGEDGHRATNSNHEHSYVDGVCECGAKENSTPTIKNGLGEDGYYYKDGARFTGSTGGYEFKNGVLLIESEKTLSGNYPYKVTHSFDKSSIDSNYLTKEVILLADLSVYVVPGEQLAVRNYLSINFEEYSMENAKAYSPDFKEKFSVTPWDSSTLNDYIEQVNKICGNETYDSIEAYPYYVQGKDYEDYSDLNTSKITFSEYLKLKYRNNVIVTGENSAISAYFTKEGTTEKISAYAYRNEEQGVGLVIGKDGKVYCYGWHENSACYPLYTEIKSGSNTVKDAMSDEDYIVEKENDVYTIKYKNETIQKLYCTIGSVDMNYNIDVEKENIKGLSIFDECSEEELLALITMPGEKSEFRINDDPEIAELFVKSLWNAYWLKVVDTNNKTKSDVQLDAFSKESFNENCYFSVFFTNGIGNAYNSAITDYVGPTIEIKLVKD